MDDPLRQSVTPKDATEDVNEDSSDRAVRGQDAKRILDLFSAGATPHIQEVRWLAAGKLDDIHGGHGQAGPIDHAAHCALQLDVVESKLRGLNLKWRLLVQVAPLLDIGMAKEGVVIKVYLRIQSQEPVLGGDHQRVDLDQGTILLLECAVQTTNNVSSRPLERLRQL